MLIGERLSPCEPRIQLEPCNCGSISKGHLEQEDMMEAFSKLMLSDGKPSFFHLAFIAYEVKIFKGSIP